MGPERWQQVDRIYHQAVVREPDERTVFLDRECAGDVELRAEVERMLAAEVEAGGFLEAPAIEVAARTCVAERVPPGSRLGPYEIVCLLEAGGMGEVYKARDTRLNRTVAIKVLPVLGAYDAERRNRFLREARAASALNHPNIVTLHDILSEGGRDALVMEYVEGQTLQEKIAGKQLPLSHVLHYAIQVADALQTAHAAGIVHRDVKPGNIMITTGEESVPGTVKVLDFGLAKFAERDSEPGRTQTMETGDGRIFGTVAYMSPEQAEGRKVDARSDIFSFGVVLYEMLTGRKAFLRDTTASTLAAILRDEFEPASGIPENLRALLERCLRKDPAKRAQSVADIKVSLEEVREQSKRAGAESVGAKRRWSKSAAVAGATAALAVAGWLVTSRRSDPPPLIVKPLTSYPGIAQSPTFSPDGNQVAFSWNGEKQDNTDIYVKLVDSGATLRLTTNPDFDGLPAWSPDGRQLAFMRGSSPGSRELWLVSPLGGAERKLADFRQGVNAAWWTAPAWTPDSKFVAVRDDTAIVLVSIESGEKRKLTVPPAGWTGDWHAAISPDGRTLAFVRIRNGPTQDVFVAPVSDGAKARQLTHDNRGIAGLAWTPDGKEIVFSSARAGERTLWRIPASGGTPERLPVVGAAASHPAFAREGRRAAFMRSTTRTSFWKQDLSPEGLHRPPVRLMTSSRTDSNPTISPDGQHITFQSDRSGEVEVWLCDSQGENALQLTSMGFARNPYWSPDGRNIVFEGRPQDRNLLFVIAAGGGKPRQLTSEEGYFPSWSRDGRWIYFYARRTGVVQTWKVPAGGGNAIQLTKDRGRPGIESMDGKYFYYHMAGAHEVWKVPVQGGAETLVAREGLNFMNLWTLGSHGLYFTDVKGAEHKKILKLLRFETGQSSQVAVLDRPAGGSGRLSLSTDSRSLLYDQIDRDESDIMLIENFR